MHIDMLHVWYSSRLALGIVCDCRRQQRRLGACLEAPGLPSISGGHTASFQNAVFRTLYSGIRGFRNGV